MTLPINDLVTFEGYFKYYKRFYCLYLKTTAYYNVRTQLLTVGRHIFYCRVRPEGLLCDAERDLLAIAKFLVVIIIAFVYNCSLYEDVDTKPQLLLFSTKRSGLNPAVINGQLAHGSMATISFPRVTYDLHKASVVVSRFVAIHCVSKNGTTAINMT